ncbi:MAG: FkbM family methyltransferase [Clostridium lundense]|nr:FkbM family methyltransferase [Clostridium lundense]
MDSISNVNDFVKIFERHTAVKTCPISMMGRDGTPVVIWGGGSLSASVKKYLDYHGIPVACYWIDGMEKQEMINNLPVYNREELCEKYESFDLVFGHSHYELRDAIRKQCTHVRRIACISNVCYQQYDRLELPFLIEHSAQYFDSYQLLQDQQSKDSMVAFLSSRMYDDAECVLNCYQTYNEPCNYFNNSVFRISDDEVYVDVGAYDGDTIRAFLKETRSFRAIYAFEPDHESFCRLKSYVESTGYEDLHIYEMGTWNERKELPFSTNVESSRILLNEGLPIGETTIHVDALDNILRKYHERITLVKINFFGGLQETVLGMKEIMINDKPKLVVTVGFDGETVMTIPRLIKQINPSYKLFLRFAAAMPARLLLLAK